MPGLFKVASFNCNSIRTRMPIILRWLAEHQPDVLCLQETKVVDGDFPRGDIEAAGYQVAFRGEKSYNGVAILSRHPLEDVKYGFNQKGEEGPRLIRARVLGITVIDTYVPQGRDIESEQFQYKLKWLSRLQKFFKDTFSPQDPLVWLGDLNIAPEPIDVYDPKKLLGHVCFNPEVSVALERIRAFGLVDVFRKHHPEPKQYTFFDYRIPRLLELGKGWRVDHIHATKSLADHSTDAYIDVEPRRAEKPSDHTFIAAMFDWPE